MTQGIECEDCRIARSHEWPLYQAGCVGCGHRMLSVLQDYRQGLISRTSVELVQGLLTKQLKEKQ